MCPFAPHGAPRVWAAPVKAVKAWLPAAGGSRYAHRERLNG
jgi:hypothetical protein